MKNWIKKFFNLYDQFDVITEALREAHNEQISFLKTQLHEKNREIQRLTDLILQEHGVIQPAFPGEKTSELKPVPRRESITEKLNRLAREDAKQAADDREKRIRETQVVEN